MSAPFDMPGPVPSGDDCRDQPVLHQPPDPVDLRLFPPQTPECARVRGMLRDFVDHDLEDVLAGEVENHVHGCRTCALALARAEYEVFRLRSGFFGGWTVVGPRIGFGKRTVARLLAETATERLLPIERAQAPNLAARVVAAIREEEAAADAPPLLRRRPRGKARSHVRSIAAVAGLGIMICAVTVVLLFQGATDLASIVRLSIVDARNTWRDVGHSRQMLRAGDGLGDGSVLIVDRGGYADVEWHDASMAGRQPAAAIVVHGDGSLRLQDGLPQLVRGSIHVSSQRRMEVLLADGSRVELGAGEYLLTATEQASTFDRLAAMAPAQSVAVEVVEGDGANVLTDGNGRTLVGAGQVGRFGAAYRGVAVENVPQPIASGSLPGSRHEEPPVAPRPNLVGSLTDAFGSAVADGQVSLVYQDAAGLRVADLPVDSGGNFALHAAHGVLPSFLLASAASPSRGLAVRDAHRVLLPADSSSTVLEVAPIKLWPTATWQGEVANTAGQPLANTKVVPCLYDELLGLVQPWPDLAVRSNGLGGFVLTGLPSGQPAHQMLGILVYHVGHDIAFRTLPPGSSVAAALGPIRIALQPLRTVRIEGLWAGSTCEVYEELATLRGTLASSGLRLHTLQCSPTGTVENLQVGPGRLWLRSGSGAGPMVRQLELAAGTNATYLPSPDRQAHTSVFRAPSEEFLELARDADQRFLVFARERHHNFRQLSGNGTFHVLPDAGFAPVLDSQVFALQPHEAGGYSARFLGVQGDGGLPMDVESQEVELLAFKGGAVRWLEWSQVFTTRVLRQQATGQIEFESSGLPLDRSVLVTLVPKDHGAAGQRPPLYRFVTQADWVVRDVPAGRYDVETELGGTHEVTVPANGSVQVY